MFRYSHIAVGIKNVLSLIIDKKKIFILFKSCQNFISISELTPGLWLLELVPTITS